MDGEYLQTKTIVAENTEAAVKQVYGKGPLQRALEMTPEEARELADKLDSEDKAEHKRAFTLELVKCIAGGDAAIDDGNTHFTPEDIVKRAINICNSAEKAGLLV